ncbi:MAG: ABC-type transport system, involved in lipoprotein release, permease component [Herbinix sp.]|jgi:putative ABC transport system permease protein|nr:ABC-type transport system, involved in lipoprotein release, permease component [Herbinix sp.]
MREILVLMKAHMRNGKSGFISILLLMLLITMISTAVISVNINSAIRDEQAIEEAGFGDMVTFMNNKALGLNGISMNTLLDQVEACEEVEKVEKIDCTYVKNISLNGKSNSVEIVLEEYNPQDFDFKVFKGDGDGIYHKEVVLSPGEVMVPISYRTLYDCHIGDTLYLEKNSGKVGFRVAYYFEDPFMGSSMMGLKTLLVCAEDLETVGSYAGDEEDLVVNGAVFNIFMKSDISLTSLKFGKTLNEQTGILGYATFSLTTKQAISYMLTITNIFSSVLAVFVILLFIVTLIVMGHSISSSIELEYVNLGILKAVGLGKFVLKASMIVHYLMAAILGILIGLPAAVPIIWIINGITIDVIGLYVSNSLAALPCTLIIAVLLIFMIIFVALKVRRISTVKPIRAIAGGREEIYFSHPLQMPIYKKHMNLWLAVRQLTSNSRQYLSVCIVTMLLVYFLVMVSQITKFFGEDDHYINKMFNCYEAEIEVLYLDHSVQGEVEAMIEDDTKIESSFQRKWEYLMFEDYQLICFVFDDAKEINSVYEGRTCLYDNEILITKFIAEDMGINLGDEVVISSGNKEAKFMVSGLYQNSSDMGSNFAINTEGYERLMGVSMKGMSDLYHVADPAKVEGIVKEVQSNYDKNVLLISKVSGMNNANFIVTAVKGLSVLIYIIAVIFAITTIGLICGKLFISEKRDFGIYKALGFSTNRLRLQFAIRFSIVAFVGCCLGVIVSLFLSNPCLGILFSYLGVSSFSVENDATTMVLPTVFMVLVYFTFSYFMSRRIKRVETRILISE